MKTGPQTLMDKYEKAKAAHDKAKAKRVAATAKLNAQIFAINKQIREIEKKHADDILHTEVAVKAAELALKHNATAAWESGNVFPAGKKRLPLDRGAWVQVAERTKYDVTDSSAATRFIIAEGIEDTAIKKLTLEDDVVKAVITLKKKFPGVYVSTAPTISISLPKTKKEA